MREGNGRIVNSRRLNEGNDQLNGQKVHGISRDTARAFRRSINVRNEGPFVLLGSLKIINRHVRLGRKFHENRGIHGRRFKEV